MKIFACVPWLLAAIAVAHPTLEGTMGSNSSNSSNNSNSTWTPPLGPVDTLVSPKCPYEPCEAACNFWPILFSFGASCDCMFGLFICVGEID
ncbi:uncharacterized protein PpBr36_09794 [Pyricularia pennisetigena]|uniref:uncharacterized protein n=1 Tax=Pyricularia pennisetigena TaxID=1578925 RepID=UPI001150B2CE|nr:uncharacterized protein PpBr36_09794 [Pyricularia pennisetigena]TLS22536.1 hypothetical protein PpBr36_09794 [Pyricularia pennisetigena]